MYIITTSCPNCFEDITVTAPEAPRYESAREKKLCANCRKGIIIVEVFTNNAIFIIYADLRHKDNGRAHRAGRWVSFSADSPPARFKRYAEAFETRPWLSFQADPYYYLQVDEFIDVEILEQQDEKEQKEAVLI